LQRQRGFRVATVRVTAFGLGKGVELSVENELTGETERYRVGDARREADGAITLLYLKALT